MTSRLKSAKRTRGFKTQSRAQFSKMFFDSFSRSRSDSIKSRIASYLYGTKINVDYDTFVSLPKPNTRTDLAEYIRLSQLEALFKKDEDLISPVDQRRAALDSFYLAERSCAEVNTALDSGNRCYLINNTDACAIFHYARIKIASILGEVPELSALDLTFGPGANTSCTKKTSARYKLSAVPSISNALFQNRMLLQQLFEQLPHIASSGVTWKVQPGKLAFVPKNYKTLRSICIEPIYSSVLQRGIGAFMKQKLKRHGIDLYDQSINRARARQGSISNDLCTIDLERASDSVAYTLVRELLPFDWYELLASCRSDFIVDPETHKLFEPQKFSSMGNGYTFELESLIFYSLAWGISRHYSIAFDLTVYGDDIVANKELATAILEWFPIFGFTVNTEKSFLDGPFRESCGYDAFLGVDVRPFFWKDRASYSLLFNFYNFLERKPHFDPDGVIRHILLCEIPEQYRTFGPDGYGDGHLISETYTKKISLRNLSKGWHGHFFETICAFPQQDSKPLPMDYILPSYVASARRKHEGSYLRRTFTPAPLDMVSYQFEFLLEEIRTQEHRLHSNLCQPTPSDPYAVKPGYLRGRWVKVYMLG